MNEELREAIKRIQSNGAFLLAYYYKDVNKLIECVTQVLNASEVMPKKEGYYGLAEGNNLVDEAIDKCTLTHTKLMLAKDKQISKLKDYKQIDLITHNEIVGGRDKQISKLQAEVERYKAEALFYQTLEATKQKACQEYEQELTKLKEQFDKCQLKEIVQLKAEIAEARKLLEGFVNDEPYRT